MLPGNVAVEGWAVSGDATAIGFNTHIRRAVLSAGLWPGSASDEVGSGWKSFGSV